MKESKIAKAIELMKAKTEKLNSLVYMSVDWLFFCGAVQGIEEIMIELGYKWDGSKFVRAQYDEKEGGNDERD